MTFIWQHRNKLLFWGGSFLAATFLAYSNGLEFNDALFMWLLIIAPVWVLTKWAQRSARLYGEGDWRFRENVTLGLAFSFIFWRWTGWLLPLYNYRVAAWKADMGLFPWLVAMSGWLVWVSAAYALSFFVYLLAWEVARAAVITYQMTSAHKQFKPDQTVYIKQVLRVFFNEMFSPPYTEKRTDFGVFYYDPWVSRDEEQDV